MPGTTNPSTQPPELGPASNDQLAKQGVSSGAMHARSERTGPRWLGLIVTLLLHVLFFIFAWVQLKPHLQPPPPRQPDADALQVQLISLPSRERTPMSQAQPVAAPPPPQPQPVALQAPPKPHALPSKPAVAKPVEKPVEKPKPVPHPATQPERVRSDAMTAAVPTSKPAPRLFDANGNPVLPTEAAKPAVKADQYIAHNQQGDTQILQQTDPTHYQATRFDAAWHRPGAGVVDRAVEKAVKKTSVGHTFHLPGGVRIHCSVSLVAMGGGCGGDPPPPPSKKDGDERLSLPPPSLLANNPHAPKPPSVESCIAAYRADKPLAPGCPFDIPQRAVDQEAKERAEQERRRTQWGH